MQYEGRTTVVIYVFVQISLPAVFTRAAAHVIVGSSCTARKNLPAALTETEPGSRAVCCAAGHDHSERERIRRTGRWSDMQYIIQSRHNTDSHLLPLDSNATPHGIPPP